MDKNAMKAYVAEHLKEKNDYSFLENDYDGVVSALVEAEIAYIEGLKPDKDGEYDYDDDDAYEYILAEMKKAYPSYKMYLECMTDDYLDVSEVYLEESGEIEWE